MLLLAFVLLSWIATSVCSYGVDLCSICGRHPAAVRDRVFKGHVADYGPWAVSLKIKRKDHTASCSGSIIGLSHVITSGHCFGKLLPARPEELAGHLEVRAGSIHVDPKLFILLEPESVHVHPAFKIANISDPNTSTLEDLAIIKLKQPIQVSRRLRPICLGMNVKMNDEVILQGYGLVNCVHPKQSEKPELSNNLMQTELTVYSERQCKELYGAKGIEVNKRHICVRSGDDLSTSCPGDSGGILGVNVEVYGQNRTYLVGLTSFGGPGDGQPDNFPAVFTRVYDYLNWIWLRTGIKPCKFDFAEEIVVNFY